jgi:predicted enzyme related to lactoylglutathione lyase
MDWKLELVAIPVSDVDRAKAFYVEQVGFVADHDQVVHEGLRFVQLTPPGSGCSIVMGEGITESPPGTAQAQLVVADVEAAREQLFATGVQVSDVQDFDWGSFVFFADPDGNRWAVQQVPPRSR